MGRSLDRHLYLTRAKSCENPNAFRDKRKQLGARTLKQSLSHSLLLPRVALSTSQVRVWGYNIANKRKKDYKTSTKAWHRHQALKCRRVAQRLEAPRHQFQNDFSCSGAAICRVEACDPWRKQRLVDGVAARNCFGQAW